MEGKKSYRTKEKRWDENRLIAADGESTSSDPGHHLCV